MLDAINIMSYTIYGRFRFFKREPHSCFSESVARCFRGASLVPKKELGAIHSSIAIELDPSF